jgi:hypothetical protein
MGKRGPVPQRRKRISCHLQILATRLLEEKIPKLSHDKRGRPLIGDYLSGLIERDLSKPEPKLMQKNKATPPPKSEPEPKTKPKSWLDEDKEAERKARLAALERKFEDGEAY